MEQSIISEYASKIAASIASTFSEKAEGFTCEFLNKVLERLGMLGSLCAEEMLRRLLEHIRESFGEEIAKLAEHVARGQLDEDELQKQVKKLVDKICQSCHDAYSSFISKFTADEEPILALSKVAVKQGAKEAVKYSAKETVRHGVKQVAKQGTKKVAQQAAKQGAKQGAKYATKAVTAAINPFGIVPDLAQAGLEITGHKKAGKAVGGGGNMTIGAIAGGTVGGPPGAIIGAAVAGGVWLFGEAIGAAVGGVVNWMCQDESSHAADKEL